MSGNPVYYDLSKGWDEFLLQNILLNSRTHTSAMEKSDNDYVKIAHIKAIEGNDKVIRAMQKYMKPNQTMMFFPSEALRIFWVLMENCQLYKKEYLRYRGETEAYKSLIGKIGKEACKDNLDEIKKLLDSSL